MKSSVMRRSKKLSNWLSRRRARARISIFLSGLPVSATSSSTTAANLKQCDQSEVMHTYVRRDSASVAESAWSVCPHSRLVMSGDCVEAAVTVIFKLTFAPAAWRASRSLLSAPVTVPIGIANTERVQCYCSNMHVYKYLSAPVANLSPRVSALRTIRTLDRMLLPAFCHCSITSCLAHSSSSLSMNMPAATHRLPAKLLGWCQL